ncbi:hypothetical protein FQN57_006215 [Myotisia sp. PD_48]|nr:hypothetical protein FQN57_006215 [Myotisia sp. PD_48]
MAEIPAEDVIMQTGDADLPVETDHPPTQHEVGSTSKIDDESTRLQALEADIRDQDDLERDIGRQADKLLNEQANERDHRRKLESQVLRLHQRLSQPIGTAARVRIEGEIQNIEVRLSELTVDSQQIQQRIEDRNKGLEPAAQGEISGRLPNETRREYLIRTGKITPFSKMGDGVRDPLTSLQDTLIDAEEEREEELALAESAGKSTVSHRHLLQPGVFEPQSREPLTLGSHSRKRRRVNARDREVSSSTPLRNSASYGSSSDSDGDYTDSMAARAPTEEFLEEIDSISDDSTRQTGHKRARSGAKSSAILPPQASKAFDDGDEKLYRSRLRDWVSRRSDARDRVELEGLRLSDNEGTDPMEGGDGSNVRDAENGEAQEEWYRPHPSVPDTVFDGGYRLPGDIFPYLFDYQKTGVQWLWELHQQQVGGIIGDEMGLGKTIQVIAFLAGLHYSKMLTKPIIVVCPPTVMRQWVSEFHRWWPPLRVSILHSSGSGMMNEKQERRAEADFGDQVWNPNREKGYIPRGVRKAKGIVNRVLRDGHVLVTTYAGLQTYSSVLIHVDWACAVLDEGHKIRNPDTAITIHSKELRTPHRLILSGTPMQNNLTELWSLFDFVFPMRLGTLVNFRNQFEFPIRQGGYANASNLQVQTAAKCAETLKDAISPYLLQRFKIDVASDLPKKSEQVLFCKLTKIQRAEYEAFLASNEMTSILRGKRQALYGIDMLRKICNHPDLAQHKTLALKPDYNYGSGAKSGKMQVVKSLLELWRDTGHKTLLFAQHRIMLDILERFINTIGGFQYRRMDGNTPIKARQGMVDEFNTDPKVHVFLLTTKVGGLGVNLTGADRVIIYDPDWNPSTDLQARERAWRLGQKREVTIYRLMTAGTIEEKIYHRQIFKQFLTNKILRDPKQRQTFQVSDFENLFTLGNDGPTETSQIFKEAQVTFEEDSDARKDPSFTTAEGRAAARKQEENDKISHVTGVASVETYKFAEDTADGQKEATEPATPDSDARIMQSLFSRSGVHSVLEHEHITNGRRTIRADPKIIEAEASRVAAEAARELLKAEEIARTIPIGTPTWTGQYGTTGRPEDARPAGNTYMYGGGNSPARRVTGGPSSASVLANLSRNFPGRPGRTGSPASAAPSTGPSGKEFMAMIRDYITIHGGAVYTQMLVNHFNRYCTSPKATAEFKEMLKAIAVLDKTGTQARGKWVLKPEYVKK